MRYPEFLPENGTVGFIAPSFGCTTEPYRSAFENAENKFRQIGYKIFEGPNCFEDCGIGISNTPRKCAAEFMGGYNYNECDALISCGGGEMMCEILPYINFDVIKKAKPKWFMGYSDNTNLTFLLPTLCDVASIYGPCAHSFGMRAWHESLFDALGILNGQVSTVTGYGKWEKESKKTPENPLEPYDCEVKTVLKTFVGKERITKYDNNDMVNFSGRLLGGCLDCLVTLCGTRFDRVKEFVEEYSTDGIIWCLEVCDLNVISTRRAMWQLEQAGWFKYAKGFIIGRPLNYGQVMFGLDYYSSFIETAGKYGVPVVMDVDMGHLPPMMPLVMGSNADVFVRDNKIKIDMKYE